MGGWNTSVSVFEGTRLRHIAFKYSLKSRDYLDFVNGRNTLLWSAEQGARSTRVGRDPRLSEVTTSNIS